jgi:hypothetical protein
MTRIQDLFAAFIFGGICVALLYRDFNRKRIVVEEVPATKQNKDGGIDTESETKLPRILRKQAKADSA